MRGAFVVAGPVVARAVDIVGKRAPVRARAGQNVVTGRQRIADAVDAIAFLGERELFDHVTAALCFEKRVSVYLRLDDRPGEIAAQIIDDPGFRVEPGSFTDTITRVDSRLTGMRPRA